MDGLLGSAEQLSTALVSVFVGFVLVLDSVPVLGILIPADVAVLAAVATRGPLGASAVVLAVVCGTMAGWTVTFMAGRFLAGPLRRSWLGRRIGAARWERAEDLVARGGGRVVLAAPFLPVFNTIVPIAAGSLRMPYRRFLAYAAVGSAVWGAGYVTIGLVAQSVGDAVFGNSNVLTTVLFGLPGVAIGWVTLAQVRRRMAVERAVAAAPAGARVVARIAAAVPSQASGLGEPKGGASRAGRAAATTIAARSSRPASRPRPVTSIARPVAASSGRSRAALTRLAGPGRAAWRSRGPGDRPRRRRAAPVSAHAPTEATIEPAASSGVAPAASPNPPMFASACTMSLWLALSNGGSGQPGVPDTAAETAANGAAAASAGAAARPLTTAQRLGLPRAVLRTGASGRVGSRAQWYSPAARNASAAVMPGTPVRYGPGSGAPGAPASLTYP
jgi:membrane protein DedA with SNARE-associated domain